jgi:hypothetical protein
MTAFASVQRDSSFGSNSAYSSTQGVKIVVNRMIMMLVIILEDRLGIGQETFDQLINQLRTNKSIYCEPHNSTKHFHPRSSFE